MSLKPSPVLFRSQQVNARSNAWLTRQLSDPYVKERHRLLDHGAHYRSRASFKLLQMDQQFAVIPKLINGFGEKMNVPRHPVVIDLGAAPGGWSQVVANKLGVTPNHLPEKGEDPYGPEPATTHIDIQQGASSGWGDWSKPLLTEPKAPSYSKFTIIALDLNEMQPITGVQSLQLSFLDPQAESIIAGMISTPETEDPSNKERPEIDLVLSDMAPNFSGLKCRDAELAMELCQQVFKFSCKYLRQYQTGRGHGLELGGNLVMKYLSCRSASKFRYEKLAKAFRHVFTVKPSASRSDSLEAYWVCKDYLGPPEAE